MTAVSVDSIFFIIRKRMTGSEAEDDAKDDYETKQARDRERENRKVV